MFGLYTGRRFFVLAFRDDTSYAALKLAYTVHLCTAMCSATFVNIHLDTACP
jgi:hypothetical protein